MDALQVLFELLMQKDLTKGHFIGFINVLIGRRILFEDGTPVSQGLSWRDVATWLRKTRWDPDAAKELGQDPKALPPRDRQRYWFTAIAQSRIDSAAAREAGDRFAEILSKHGYQVAGPKK